MNEREKVADELRRIRDGVREAAGAEPRPDLLPPPLGARTPTPMPPDARPAPLRPTARPDNAELNDRWRVTAALQGGGLRRLLARGLGRLLARMLEAQEAFNSRQVRFDNELLDYIDARLAATHLHYDDVLGIHGRHMGEIDERHLILQEELVAHVHDLVKRIDLVLAEAEKGRITVELALLDARARLAALEEILAQARGTSTPPRA